MKIAGNNEDEYLCTIEADNKPEELFDTLRCCREFGGKFSEDPLRCILSDVPYNPRNDWRQCAERLSGFQSAECYPSNEGENDDELAGRGPRDHRKNHRKNHRNGDDRMTIFDGDSDDEFVCRVDLIDPNWRRDVLERCCEEEVHGRIEGENEVCLVNYFEDTRRFEVCARNMGAQNARCRPE